MKYLKIPFSEETDFDKVNEGHAFLNPHGSLYFNFAEEALLLVVAEGKDILKRFLVDEDTPEIPGIGADTTLGELMSAVLLDVEEEPAYTLEELTSALQIVKEQGENPLVEAEAGLAGEEEGS